MCLSTQSLIGSINTKDAVIVKNVILHISTQVTISISLFTYTILVNVIKTIYFIKNYFKFIIVNFVSFVYITTYKL